MLHNMIGTGEAGRGGREGGDETGSGEGQGRAYMKQMKTY